MSINEEERPSISVLQEEKMLEHLCYQINVSLIDAEKLAVNIFLNFNCEYIS